MITQQLECYAAQEALERGRRFTTIAEVQRFVDDLRDTPWWVAQRYSQVLRIEVAPSRSQKFRGQAHYDREKGAGMVMLTPDGMTMRTVLHEVAHVLAAAIHGSKSHDPWWARIYLTLVSQVMGTDAYLTLQRSFDATGVDYDAPTAPINTGVIAL